MEKNIICFDLETTGKEAYKDEILQCSIIDGQGKVLFNEYCKPAGIESWLEAEAVNHISPEMVKDKKHISEYKDVLIPIFNNADIIITFNGDTFDIPMIQRLLKFEIKGKSFDVMKRFTEGFALYNHINYRFKLSQCCKCLGITNEKAHDALGDVKATLACFYKMIEEGKKPKLHTIHKFKDGTMIYSDQLAEEYKKNKKQSIVETIYIDSNGKRVENPNFKNYRIGNFIKV